MTKPHKIKLKDNFIAVISYFMAFLCKPNGFGSKSTFIQSPSSLYSLFWVWDIYNPDNLTPCWPLNTIRTIRKKVKNQDIHPFYNCTTHTPEALTFTPPWFWLFPDHQQPFKLHPFIYYSIHTFGSSIILPPRFSPPNHERFHFKIEN